MSCPFAEPIRLPFYGGLRTILKRDAMLIRVTTDAGLKGFAPGPAHERAAREIEQTIGPFLEGRDPADWRSFGFAGGLELRKTYHAVEVAVIDAAAKAEGAPMSDLLGGRKRGRIKCYGSAGMYMPPEGYAAEAAAVQELGFPAYKLRPAAGPQGRSGNGRGDAPGRGAGFRPDARLPCVVAHGRSQLFAADDRRSVPRPCALRPLLGRRTLRSRRPRRLRRHARQAYRDAGVGRARARRGGVSGPDSFRRRGFRADGRVLPRRVRDGPAHFRCG